MENFSQGYADYDEFIDDVITGGEALPPEEGRPARFMVDSDAKADWALSKLARLEAKRVRRNSLLEERRMHDEAFREKAEAEDQRLAEWLTSQLRTYYDALKAAGEVTDKRKLYKLPSGSLTTRKVDVEYERDNPAILEWLGERDAWVKNALFLAAAAEQHGVKITVAPVWSVLKDQIVPLPSREAVHMPTGEAVPGVTVKQFERQVFTVKPFFQPF